MEYEIKLLTTTNMEDILKITDENKLYLKQHGIDQWQNGYPNEQSFLEDIKQQSLYGLFEEDILLGFFMLSFEREPSYTTIVDGSWKQEGSYGVLHRVCLSNQSKGKGYAQKLIKFSEIEALKRDINALRIDTHEDNNSMRKLLDVMNFEYCGKIALLDGSIRLAFEKILPEKRIYE